MEAEAIEPTPKSVGYAAFKRMLDIVGSTILLIVLFPLFALITLGLKLTSGGRKYPVIFRQKRVGQDGKTFYVHKFRSMYGDWETRFPGVRDWSANEEEDVRVTPIGRILRKTDLDELPQLWDILIGAMSFVGPRPEQPKYVEKFAQEIPDYMLRHGVKTGLTGWAQVNGLRGDTSVAERVKYDLYYIQNCSVVFDLKIIGATAALFLRQIFDRKARQKAAGA